ncbi:hypothetical protein SADUNF_Sadunf19G0104000 [Salix dunnii]|uniref:Bifunctional inhibitor/plant lipid transfer protein/seed storage helical domain-containing protein n=1 Tax=Salix dunnii TaxID=1413687 RepID=A0A835MLG4_9ROSI|nr:hypothetical protein SADUNF_Sadunf19G0104000 [Salix dunnii]
MEPVKIPGKRNASQNPNANSSVLIRESSCGDLSSDLAACVSYLIGKAGDIPPPQCCAGRVIKLKDGAVTIADKHDVACKCVKAAAAPISGKGYAASSLPTECKIQMEIPISKNFNCSDLKPLPRVSFLRKNEAKGVNERFIRVRGLPMCLAEMAEGRKMRAVTNAATKTFMALVINGVQEENLRQSCESESIGIYIFMYLYKEVGKRKVLKQITGKSVCQAIVTGLKP